MLDCIHKASINKKVSGLLDILNGSQEIRVKAHFPFKRFQHLPNIRSTNVERMLGKCWTNVERSVQTASTLFNIFVNKENVVWMLNESLNRFKDGTY